MFSTEMKQLSCLVILRYRYIADVLSINSKDFENDIGQTNSVELEIKDMTEVNNSVSY